MNDKNNSKAVASNSQDFPIEIKIYADSIILRPNAFIPNAPQACDDQQNRN